MSTPINDGGPAFPTPDAEPGFQCSYTGMTLRDWFAGQAMAGFLANDRLCDAAKRLAEEEGKTPEATIAARVFMFADAMLTERAKGGAK